MKKTVLILFVTLSCNLFSQSDAVILDKLIRNDSASITLLFSYPDSVRFAIFLSSTYPQGFVRLDEIQKSTSESFRKLVSKYSKEKQQQFYDITRYPEVISLLIKNREKSANEMNQLLKDYPQKIQSAAKDLREKDQETLKEIEQLHSLFNEKYKDVVKSFPVTVQGAFTTLLKTPEVVKLLSDEIKTTVVLGDVYKRNPALLKQKADSMSTEIAKQKVLDLQDWTKKMSSDTTDRDLKKIAEEYAKEHNDNIEASNEPGNLYVVHDFNPYSYWSGYPYWYAGPFWYPYPWWYHCGYYWNPSGTIVFISLPTYYFGWWYFNDPQHHYYYPQTSDHFYNHYYGHRESFYGFNTSVREWERNNSTRLPENFRKSEGPRVEQFREFGRKNLNRQLNEKPVSPGPARESAPQQKTPGKAPEAKPSPSRKPAHKTVPAPQPAPIPAERPAPVPAEKPAPPAEKKAPPKKAAPGAVEKPVPDVKPAQPPIKRTQPKRNHRPGTIPKKTKEK